MSEHSARIERFWRDNQLFSALVELTYRCNLDCFFCYNDVGLAGTPLAFERYGELLEEMARLGVLHLTLSGGEPLAHPDFFRIGARARELGYVVRVKSNGHALRGALARRLRDEVDPYLIEVSLHGAVAATHDRQTRVPGSFERLLANLEGLRELGLRFQINSTLTAWNEAEFEGMYAIADRFAVRLQIDPEVTPRDDGSREPLSIAASREGLRRLFEFEAERSRTYAASQGGGAAREPAIVRQGDSIAPPSPRANGSGKFCGAGSSNVCIDPYGNVYPCVQWRRPVGNLHESTLAEIWATSRGLADVRELEWQIARRLAGEESSLLGFCPGQAEIVTGDAAAIYPAAVVRRELLREVNRESAKRALLPVIRG